MSSFTVFSFSPLPEEVEQQCRQGFNPKVILWVKNTDDTSVRLEVSVEKIVYWHGSWEFSGWVCNHNGVILDGKLRRREDPVTGWYKFVHGKVQF